MQRESLKSVLATLPLTESASAALAALLASTLQLHVQPRRTLSAARATFARTEAHALPTRSWASPALARHRLLALDVSAADAAPDIMPTPRVARSPASLRSPPILLLLLLLLLHLR